VLGRILRLAATRWRDEKGISWLATAPEIVRVPGERKRSRPISWDEQDSLFKELPQYLAEMALFAVNTGLRQQEVCRLSWDWEVQVNELETSVFLIPGDHHKNGEERIVVLNRTAESIIESRRGKHRNWVFGNPKTGQPYYRMTNSAWVAARSRAGLQDVRVHDLRHTFGHRLRAEGVGIEDRQVLLGHKSNRITTDYSAPDVSRLIESANRLCERNPTTILRSVPQSCHTQRQKQTVVISTAG
jgi:integrase